MEDWKIAGSNSDGKADIGKSMMSLLYVQFGELNKEISDVLTFGAEKYVKPVTHDSWRSVPEGRRRYIDAAMRHFHKYFVEGEECDKESGLNHLAHMMTNFHFVYEIDQGRVLPNVSDDTSDKAVV